MAIGQRGYNTRIKWHVDYYLTGEYWRFEALRQQEPSRLLYSAGAGQIKRGPASIMRPDPSTPRKWIYQGVYPIRDVNSTVEPYAIVLYMVNTTVGGQTFTTFRIAYWHLLNAESDNTRISVADIYEGKLEEYMELPSDSIVGAWFAPIPYDTRTDDKKVTAPNTGYVWWEVPAGSRPKSYTETISLTPQKTSDSYKWLIVDPMGTTYATIPWMMEFDGYKAALDIGTSGAFVNVDITKAGATTVGEGMNFQIPLIAAPITANNLSDYVLSGQQQYDRTMAQIQSQQNLKSGVASSGNSALGGLLGGAMVGGPAGAIVGAVGGFALGTASAFMNQAIQEEADRKSQAATETLLSNQTSGVMISGGGSYWYRSAACGIWGLLFMARDSQSMSELSDDQTERGYITDAWLSDCSSVIAAGGGLRIEGLEVRGAISNEGRQYIRALFARGVHIDILT